MNLYEKIKLAAKNKGYSINYLEKELGYSRSSISKFKENTPSVDKVQEIAKFLGVSMDDLMGTNMVLEDDMPENIRAVARDLMDLPEENRKLAIDMIKMMSQRGKEAKDK